METKYNPCEVLISKIKQIEREMLTGKLTEREYVDSNTRLAKLRATLTMNKAYQRPLLDSRPVDRQVMFSVFCDRWREILLTKI